jgi:peptidoglycan/LPS O-acetylase OafA/YrhL
MRRNEIDWIRNIGVLLLFLFHTASVFTYYEPWYIWYQSKSWAATIIFIFCIPWHMPVLFFLAGASTRFSLDTRSEKKYVMERVKRLLIPFILGMLILVPPQGYFARVSRGKPVGTYFQQYKYFWTTISSIPYDGGLGPAHLWFILYLFIISIISIFIIRSLKKESMKKFLLKFKDKMTSKISLIFSTMILFIADMTPLAIAEKNILIFLIVFLMGYIAYGDEEYLEYIDKNKIKSLIITGVLFGVYIFLIIHHYNSEQNQGLEILLSLMRNCVMITTITAIIGYGRKYLNKEGKVLKYLNKACFPVYILHQPIIVVISYYLLKYYKLPIHVSILIILISSVIVTFGVYELFKRIKITRYLIGGK